MQQALLVGLVMWKVAPDATTAEAAVAAVAAAAASVAVAVDCRGHGL